MVQILDQFGRPINREVLKTPQTTKMASLNRMWPEHPSKGMTIRRLPRILEAAERGDLAAQADLFEDMIERDGHIFSEMAKRKNALLTLDWSIEPPENATGEEKKIAEMVSAWMKDIPEFEDITLNAADAIGHGFAAQEIEKWELEDKIWLPSKIKLRPHRWFCTNPEAGDEIRLSDGSMNGAELWPFGWLVHTHNAKSGYVAQSGLYRVLVWPYLFKNYGIRDLAEFLEIYGLPARVGTYLAGATDDDKDRLLEALVTLGHDAAGIIPEGTKIEFLTAASGQADPFVAMVNWAERTASKVILGATLTSQADGKSSTNALGKVHNDVRHDILIADARQIEGFYRGFIRMLLAINGYQVSSRRQPRLVFDTRELESIKEFAEGVSTLVTAGLKTIPASWVHKKIGIPNPQEGEAVLSPPATAPVLPGARLSQQQSRYRSFAALSTEADIADPAQVALDNAQTVPDAINNAMQQLIAPLVAALSQGNTPDDALDIIAASYPDLDDSQLQQLLTQALFVADIWGHLNADS
ncbi:DUF935 domain-containing protein [Serratia marcescens]|jgi:phage gp29-like protein|uniref:DUF935 domain-containing protein n=1 Tax=Serratia marcescens TaxID=615 RepID=UPI000744DBA5|nr:DUF935 domain-containing protein [Serratia marcescens]BEL74468.1 hypothetical protein SM12BL1_07710 [Serratia marcescens]CUZ16461.1 Mu-like prophage protein gp29 [Serratia marcescens]